MKHVLAALLTGTIITSCSVFDTNEEFPYHFELHNIHADVHIRGAAAVSDSVCWLSGTQGSVFRTSNGGDTWTHFTIPSADSVDLRDIEALNENTAIAMGVGSPAKIFKTKDGGKSWYMTYYNDHPDIFLDGIAFLNNKVGIAFGDAIDNHIVILRTTDGGDSWHLIPNKKLPKAMKGEGGFAASGTSIRAVDENRIFIGLGYPRGRLIYSEDQGENWNFYLTGLGNTDSSRGVYSIDFDSNNNGIAVGGDWKDKDNINLVAATSHDGGLHWEIVTENPPSGYRSAVCFIPNTKYAITTGPNGTDYSSDKGSTWKLAKTGGANTISFSPSGKTGWLAGNKGRIVTVQAISE